MAGYRYSIPNSVPFMERIDQAHGRIADPSLHLRCVKTLIQAAMICNDMETVTRLVKQNVRTKADFHIERDGTVVTTENVHISIDEMMQIAALVPQIMMTSSDAVAERETEDTKREREEALEALKRGDVL